MAAWDLETQLVNAFESPGPATVKLLKDEETVYEW
jgi:hypothetical protein